MNFISNVLDSIPVVGHAKGVVHYVVGDKDGGDKAMHKSTRTSAAITGGVIGGVTGAVGGAIDGTVRAVGGAMDGARAVGGSKGEPSKKNFVSNALDATPGVGHAKGVLHYVVGDKDGGDKAMYRATRTSAAIAGGVIGLPAGAVGGAIGGAVNGAASGAMYGGCLTDSEASGSMDKPQRIYRHRENTNNY